MLHLASTLVVVGLSVLNLGSIKEADGTVKRDFWLRNEGKDTVMLISGYTSCGCTTVAFEKNKPIASGDSTMVTLYFNPRGKGGEFYENATFVTADSAYVNVALEGECITSQETLLKQYPIQIDNGIRLSVNHFDLGYLSRGEKKERYVSVLYPDGTKETIMVTLDIDAKMNKGLQHITRTVYTKNKTKIDVLFDVYVK